MGRARAQHAEVAWRIDQPTAEMIQPEAIRKDSAHEGMVPLYQMSRVSEPTARGGQRGVLVGNLVSRAFGRGDAQVTRPDRLRGLTMVPAMEDLRRRQNTWNLVEHADEIFDWLFGAF